ncbi:MAG: 2-dehydro-3-deoxygalactonokinase [Bacteroidota bacterium]
MNTPSAILSCDWGTSQLRLQLVELETGAVLSKCKSNVGIKKMHKQWKKAGGDRASFFLQGLKVMIEELVGKVGHPLPQVPIVMSGMASSSLGLRELAYAKLPFDLNGTNLVWELLPASPDFPHNIFLISGIEKQDDVIRGEESELIGLASLNADFPSEYMLILPGTHSKHLKIADGKVVDFKTYLTGEMFDILRKHSVLKNRMARKLKKKMNDGLRQAFLQGVEAAKAPDINRQIFSIRAKSLQGSLRQNEATYYLSGLLIGHEIQELEITESSTCVLAANKKMCTFYQLALEHVGWERLLVVDPKVYNQLAVTAHLHLFNRYFSTARSPIV